jgi:hypothetical protein
MWMEELKARQLTLVDANVYSQLHSPFEKQVAGEGGYQLVTDPESVSFRLDVLSPLTVKVVRATAAVEHGQGELDDVARWTRLLLQAKSLHQLCHATVGPALCVSVLPLVQKKILERQTLHLVRTMMDQVRRCGIDTNLTCSGDWTEASPRTLTLQMDRCVLVFTLTVSEGQHAIHHQQPLLEYHDLQPTLHPPLVLHGQSELEQAVQNGVMVALAQQMMQVASTTGYNVVHNLASTALKDQVCLQWQKESIRLKCTAHAVPLNDMVFVLEATQDHQSLWTENIRLSGFHGRLVELFN